jgi:phosphoadenosine phosphosulfate reductase
MSNIRPLAPEHGLVNQANRLLPAADAETRVDWALSNLPHGQVLASSFGAQSAVMLHLLTRQRPDIPVIFIDTGYHFAETYRFVDVLHERLDLNLHVYRARTSAAWQEARHGKRWEAGREGIEAYNQENKVEPMQRALRELSAATWFSGIRRNQAISRADTRLAEFRNGRVKFHPIIDWTDRQVHDYLSRHKLPYHPLWEKGYVSIGDWHTTRPLSEVDGIEGTRFFGLKRECGLHESV